MTSNEYWVPPPRYELEKRRAVEHEDYDLAKSKKAQMEEYRLKVYQQLRKHNLLLDAGVSPVKLEGASPLKQGIFMWTYF